MRSNELSRNRYMGDPDKASPEDARELERLLRLFRGNGRVSDWESLADKELPKAPSR
jgi:hypothetical protein